MPAVQIGSKGLLNGDLVIVQSASFSATFVHEDAEGHAIDHTGWQAWCRVKGGALDLDLSSRVGFGGNGEITLAIPDEVTATIPLGTYEWDMIVEDTAGFATRIAWGRATIYDSYARDA